jgi:hypothetical protein
MCRFTFPTIHNFKNECMFGYGLEFSLLNLEWKDSHMFVVLKMLQLFSAHVSGGNLDPLVNFGIFWFLAHEIFRETISHFRRCRWKKCQAE